MFVVINELFVPEEGREGFERNFSASMRGTLPDVPGLHAGRLLRPEQPDRGYLAILEFADETAFIAYRGSDAFRRAHSWPDPAPVASSRLAAYSVLTEIPGPGVALD